MELPYMGATPLPDVIGYQTKSLMPDVAPLPLCCWSLGSQKLLNNTDCGHCSGLPSRIDGMGWREREFPRKQRSRANGQKEKNLYEEG